MLQMVIMCTLVQRLFSVDTPMPLQPCTTLYIRCPSANWIDRESIKLASPLIRKSFYPLVFTKQVLLKYMISGKGFKYVLNSGNTVCALFSSPYFTVRPYLL